MAKLLFITNLAHNIGSFSMAGISSAHHLGIDFYIAANWQKTARTTIDSLEDAHNITIADVPISRSPLAKTNIVAYKQLISLIQNENIDYIHCNTPTGGILGRLAGKKCNVKKVIYQAHGFHFYKGSPKLNWLLYYPVEKWLAHYTDAIITINREDYELAKRKLKLRRGGKVYYVPGVGIDTSLYTQSEALRAEKRAELGLGENDVTLISMGDLIGRKNYDTAIRAIAQAANPALHYFICGKGPEEEKLKTLAASLGIAEQIHFLGFRSDIKELLTAADIFLFTTKQEGLPRSMMEAMASGLPCIASKIRGNTDLLENTEGGFLCESTDTAAFAEKIALLANDKAMRIAMGKQNLLTIQAFSLGAVTEATENIYNAELTPPPRGLTLADYCKQLIERFSGVYCKRAELNLPPETFVLISVGELGVNKNNTVILSALEKLGRTDIHYVLCGTGEQREALEKQAAAAGLEKQVHFLGFRNDVKDLYAAADCFVMPSFREGLSRSMMEAMASGLPCIASKIRGNVDLVEEGENGFLCAPTDVNGFATAIQQLADDKVLCEQIKENNLKKIKNFDISVVEEKMKEIYQEVLRG